MLIITVFLSTLNEKKFLEFLSVCPTQCYTISITKISILKKNVDTKHNFAYKASD